MSGRPVKDRASLRWTALGLAASVLAVLLSSCGPSPTPDSTVRTPPPTTDRAVLDRERSSITLPLDAYGMSVHDSQVVHAAQTIVLWQCLMPGQTLPDDVLLAARAWFAYDPTAGSWMFGCGMPRTCPPTTREPWFTRATGR